MVHGVGTCAKQFDLPLGPGAPPTPSLSRWLAANGYDTWSCDLRGVLDSASPGNSGRDRWGWSVDDHLLSDIPALIGYILEHAQCEQLHWIGHSMGGILLLCYCALHGSDQVASGVAAAAALDYSGFSSRYDLIVPLRELGRLMRRIPSGTFARLIAPFFGNTDATNANVTTTATAASAERTHA